MKRSFRHWTFRYIADRTALALYERFHPNAPWLTRQAVDFLANWLRPNDSGLEWGSGRSTVWFAHRVSRLMSIEHNKSWHDVVKSMLAERSLGNVDYRYHAADPARETGSLTHPYVTAGAQLPAESADFVLVDGAYRDCCAAIALSRVKPGGIIIVDNVNWFLPHASRSPSSILQDKKPVNPLWQEFQHMVENWRSYWTSNGVTDTAIFFKP
jgi:predicted O-methyltransferase YrrM